MRLSFSMQVYLVLTLVFLATTFRAVSREMRARPDFETTPFGGIMNAYRYYRFVRRNNEKLSPRFMLLFPAYANFALCAAIIAADVFAGM